MIDGYKNLRNVSGIYCIENVINDRIYIGSSINVSNRIRQHYNDLCQGIHNSDHLQNAWNKHGIDKFRTYLLEEATEDELLIREQYYLNVLLYAQEYISGQNRKFLEIGYNVNPNVNSMTDWHKDKSNKEKFKQSIAKSSTHLSKVNKKSVLAYNRLTGKFVKKCDSVVGMAEFLGVSKENLRKVLRGTKRYTHDTIVKFKESDGYPLQIEPVAQYIDIEGRKKSLDGVHASNYKTILQCDLNGRVLKEHTNAVEAAKSLGVGTYPSGLTRCANGKLMTSYGFIWKYK